MWLFCLSQFVNHHYRAPPCPTCTHTIPKIQFKVDPAELKKAMESLVRPCSLLRFERKQRRERQQAAAVAAQKAESWKEEYMQKMDALDKSKASHFLDVVSTELRQRRWKIRDIFRDVDKGKSGSLGESLTAVSLIFIFVSHR